MDTWERKAGTKPNQHNRAHPRAEPLRTGSRFPSLCPSPLPCPKAQAGQLLILEGRRTPGKNTCCRGKGEEVGEGADLRSFCIPRLHFLSKQSPHCYPIVTVPQKVQLLVQPETLRGKGQKILPVGTCCGGKHSCTAWLPQNVPNIKQGQSL